VAFRSDRIEDPGGFDATHGLHGQSRKEGLSMQTFAPFRIAFIFLFLPFSTGALAASNKVISKLFVTEPPALISLGFEWEIDGDDNRNAEVAVPGGI
jgi:hypothetical protein